MAPQLRVHAKEEVTAKRERKKVRQTTHDRKDPGLTLLLNRLLDALEHDGEKLRYCEDGVDLEVVE